MPTLHDVIARSASAALGSQSPDGSMPPGHNGPYGDPETPVRTTGHWLITWASAYRTTGDVRFLRAAERAAAYLQRPEHRPGGATFWHRDGDGRNRCNGLVGQAWTIEALVEAARTLESPRCLGLARSVFLLHPFIDERGLWQRVEVDGSVMPHDLTFNHQLWFAAAGAQLMDGDHEIGYQVGRFIDQLPRNLALYRSGLIYHRIGPARPGRRSRLRDLRGKPVPIDRHHDPAYAKAIGYHAFNLYGLALLKQLAPSHRFWSSRRLARALGYADSREFSTGLEDNPFGYAYNPAGIEVAFAVQTFAGRRSAATTERVRSWTQQQFDRTYASDRERMVRGAADPNTLAARLYEATRLGDVELDVAPALVERAV